MLPPLRGGPAYAGKENPPCASRHIVTRVGSALRGSAARAKQRRKQFFRFADIRRSFLEARERDPMSPKRRYWRGAELAAGEPGLIRNNYKYQ